MINMERKLWYLQPAKRWDEALPLGNGRMGAMVFGGTNSEHIQMNEDSVWYGKSIDRLNPDAGKHMEEVRHLIFEHKFEEAERLALCSMSGTPESQRQYQNLGDIYIELYHSEEVKNYKRELDLETGIAGIEYEAEGIKYEREIFISSPDQVMIVRLKASGSLLNGVVKMERGRFYDHSWAMDEHTIAMNGCSKGEGIHFCAGIRAVPVKGTINVLGDQILIKDAEEVILIISSATSFRYRDPVKTCRDTLTAAEKKSYEELCQSHISDYQTYFKRMEISFGEDGYQDVPTDVRLARVKEGADDYGLLELYVQFGRYLLIASSRLGSLPANLQGIWCNEYMPIWDSKYTININTEMNYWPAETCNLSEMHMPLFELIKRMVKNGQKTAREMYGCRGFVAHHNTDIYADTAPQDKCITSTFWVMGGAWLCLHIWNHYLYTNDSSFLETYYDCLEQAVLFFEDFLIPDSKNRMVVSPSLSPENSYLDQRGRKTALTYGTTMDSEILTELFEDYIEASKILGKECEEERLNDIIRRLPKPQIGKHGQLMEWIEDYEEAYKGHRHISHLFGLYPGNQFTKEETPELIEACEVTLNRRLEYGSGYTGWSRAWIACFWARLRDGNKAYESIKVLLGDSTFSNLMDNHPCEDDRGEYKVFQMDGNSGATAAIVEMLIQSYPGKIYLLPAIPDGLPNGFARGIKIIGGSEIDLVWREGRLVHCCIYPAGEEHLTIRYQHEILHIKTQKDKKIEIGYDELNKKLQLTAL